MRPRHPRHPLALILCLLLAASLAAPLEAAHLTVLHLNDTHGHAWPYRFEGAPEAGGFAAAAARIRRIREEVEARGGHVLLLHAGDFNTGVPESDLQEAVPDLEALNALGCDALTLGNHEFDRPREVLLRQQRRARFPFLGANVLDPKGNPAFSPGLIRDFGDLKVGILGLLTESTPRTEPFYLEGLRVSDPREAARRWAPELRRRGAEVVLALTHLGWGAFPGQTSAEELAESVPGLDAIVDGHSHTLFDQAPVVNGVVVVQAGWGTRYLGRLDLEVQGGRVVSWDWRALPLDIPPPGAPSTSIPPDRDMELLLTPYLWAGRTRLDQVVGRTEVFLKGDRGSIRGRGTNLGNWITDAFRDRGEAEGAFLNAGSVRDSLAAGDITMGDLLRVLPFPQTLTVFSLKGSEILEVLRYAASIPPGSGGTLLSSGVTALFRGGEVSDVRVGGLPLDPDRVYRIATTSYLAGGGDGYRCFLPWKDRSVDLGLSEAEVARQTLQRGPVKEVDETPRIRRETP